VRRDVFVVNKPGLFGATSSHFFTQSPQNVAVEPGIHSLACWASASRYHNCCIDGDTSTEYFGYHLVYMN
jgi:hypothetical protein